MKWRPCYLFLPLAAGGALALSTNTEATRSGCYQGQVTRLTAKWCANAWPSEDAKFRWQDLSSSCDPNDILCDSTKVVVAQTLNAADCTEVKVLSILSSDHLARIRCQARPDEELLINLDALTCHPRNTFNYRNPDELASLPPPEPLSGAIAASTGTMIVERAEERMKQMRTFVASDTRILLQLVKKTEPSLFGERLLSAASEIARVFREVKIKQDLDGNCEPLSPSRVLSDDQVRAQRTCRLLSAAAATSDIVFASAQQWAKEMPGPDAAHWQAVALRKTAIRLASDQDPYRQADALAMRMLLFYALKSQDPELPNKLKLIRRAVETHVTDTLDRPFWELHAGFVFGGSRLRENSGGGYDCSDFIQSLLNHRSKGGGLFSTLRLKRVARYLSGDLPRKSLSKDTMRLSNCFSSVDLRAGKTPQPGDFVVSNNETLKNGHVAIVKKFLDGQSVQTIEAAGGGANTIMSKIRPLLEPAPSCPQPEERLPIRPDLYVLRLKTPLPSSCPLKLNS